MPVAVSSNLIERGASSSPFPYSSVYNFISRDLVPPIKLIVLVGDLPAPFSGFISLYRPILPDRSFPSIDGYGSLKQGQGEFF